MRDSDPRTYREGEKAKLRRRDIQYSEKQTADRQMDRHTIIARPSDRQAVRDERDRERARERERVRERNKERERERKRVCLVVWLVSLRPRQRLGYKSWSPSSVSCMEARKIVRETE